MVSAARATAEPAGDVVFGVVDAPSSLPSPLAEKLCDVTVSWCRYGYRGPILRGPTVDAVLRQAAERRFHHCFIQFAGHLIRERWAANGSPPDMPALLAEIVGHGDYLVAGFITGDDTQGYGLDSRCLLVDVGRHAALGSPAFGAPAPDETVIAGGVAQRTSDGDIVVLAPATHNVRQRPTHAGWNLVDASLRAGLPVRSLAATLAPRTLDLGATDAAQAAALAPYLGAGIERAHDGAAQRQLEQTLSDDQRDFLSVIARQTGNARRGVFLWNIEPYGDAVADEARPRAATLYAVAAGFKPNAILHVHGFGAESEVVFFDYSERALAIRRFLVESWDGTDFPGLVRDLVRVFPVPETYYHLPGDNTPEGIDWKIVEQAWERELRWWGGAEDFCQHWQAYRRLPHRYVACNLLDDPGPVLRAMQERPRPGDVVWWSNAFFTMYSNWFHAPAERQRVFEHWMAGLAAASPQAFLYGSDYANANVNGLTASDYWTQYRRIAPGFLEPAALHRTAIRM